MQDGFGFPQEQFTTTLPIGSNSRGTVGQSAIDKINKRIYRCVLPDYWISQPYTEFGAIPLLWTSDGDANGVFYFAGTNYGLNVWANPYTQGFVGVAPVPNAIFNNVSTDLPEEYFNRAVGHVDLSGTAPLAYIVDLKAGNALIINRFTYRYRNDSTSFTPTGWTVEGSNDQSTWTTVLTVTGATPGLSTWVSSAITGQTVAYRYWRVKQTAADNTGFFTTGQIEMYGTLIRA